MTFDTACQQVSVFWFHASLAVHKYQTKPTRKTRDMPRECNHVKYRLCTIKKGFCSAAAHAHAFLIAYRMHVSRVRQRFAASFQNVCLTDRDGFVADEHRGCWLHLALSIDRAATLIKQTKIA
eukprot:6176429-Pleurochrysis_carterae.AAC.3